jgi:hypothetical protein
MAALFEKQAIVDLVQAPDEKAGPPPQAAGVGVRSERFRRGLRILSGIAVLPRGQGRQVVVRSGHDAH